MVGKTEDDVGVLGTWIVEGSRVDLVLAIPDSKIGLVPFGQIQTILEK